MVQAAVMIGVLIFIEIKGVLSVGGLSETMRIAEEGHRLDVKWVSLERISKTLNISLI